MQKKYKKLFRLSLSTAFISLLLSGSVMAAPILRVNSHGHDVLVLQQQLRRAGYAISSIDGVFGNETKQAVSEFQRDQKIKVTGIVDGSTWRALNQAKNGSHAASIETSASSAQPYAPAQPTTRTVNVPESQPFLSRAKVNSIIATAKKYIGVPYKFGGTSPKAFDCSGYVQYVFAQNGLTLPRTADLQYKLGRRTTSQNQLVPGDLVFFTTYEPGASHCGIYLGNGQFIHTSSSHGVRIDNLSSTYWQPRYYGGKHIVE